MKRLVFAGATFVGLMSCGSHESGNGGGDGGTDAPSTPDACVGLQCQVVACEAMGMPPTTITGTVFAPNGTLPLYDVNVYVPNTDPGPLAPGLSCSTCAAQLPGNPIQQTTTGVDGSFELSDVPSGSDIPLVITIGKWRRQITIPAVTPCGSNSLGNADTTLPKSTTDLTPNTKSVDMPKIALSTGNADSMECLVRRLGIADKEISTDGQPGQVHFFADTQSGAGEGVSSFDTSNWTGGSGAFTDSQVLWGSAGGSGELANFDIVILSCEGDQHDETKSQQALDNMKAYADAGGRVFASHWHNIWLEGNTHQNGNHVAPTEMPGGDWPQIATFTDNNPKSPDDATDLINEVDNPKGSDFASWMLGSGVGGSTVRDQVDIKQQKTTCSAVSSDAEDWMDTDATGSAAQPQMFQFTTPQEQQASGRCGKFVFTDMHVSGNGNANQTYPTSCGADDTLSPQEKALAFMFFDISSCVGTID